MTLGKFFVFRPPWPRQYNGSVQSPLNLSLLKLYFSRLRTIVPIKDKAATSWLIQVPQGKLVLAHRWTSAGPMLEAERCMESSPIGPWSLMGAAGNLGEKEG